MEEKAMKSKSLVSSPSALLGAFALVFQDDVRVSMQMYGKALRLFGDQHGVLLAEQAVERIDERRAFLARLADGETDSPDEAGA
jgi:hypothetical protein